MRLNFLGGCQEVGKSSLVVDAGVKVMLDAGIRVHDSNTIPPLQKASPDAAVITHGHLDHCGGLPALYKHRPVHSLATFPTIPLINLLIEDSEKIALSNRTSLPYGRQDIKKMNAHLTPLPFNAEYEFYDGTTVEMLDAGHILGSAMVLVKNRKNLLYTGDFNAVKTRLHNPAKPPDCHVDALVIESTYALRDHPDRKKLEKKLVKTVSEAIDARQTVLMPAFAVGRTQELLTILANTGLGADVCVDGMGRKVLEIMAEYSGYVSDYKNLAHAVRKTVLIEGDSDRRKALKTPSVIITTAGMLDGGPALSYLKEMQAKNNGVILLTGYQVPGTNGASILKGEKIKINNTLTKITLPVKQFDFSAHAGRTELFEFVDKVSPEKVFCVHGDQESCVKFAEELKAKGYDATAPKLDEKADV